MTPIVLQSVPPGDLDFGDDPAAVAAVFAALAAARAARREGGDA